MLANESDNSTKSISGNPNNLASVIGAVDGNEVLEILDNIWNERSIVLEYPECDSLRNFGQLVGFKVHLTPNGIERAKLKFSGRDINPIDSKFEYDIVFSFAGEDRNYVERIAKFLAKSEIKFFYDKYEESKLWGKNLYDYLDHIYRKSAKYCVMVLSEQYAKKLWTNHERKSAQARAFEQNQEYILPIKLDNTEIPGILPTINYVNGREKTPEQIAEMILEKLTTRKEAALESNKFYYPKSSAIIFDTALHKEINEILKRVYSNSERLSIIIADCLLLAKKINNKELERYCTVELNGIKRGEYYPDFLYRKIDVYASKDQINPNWIGWGNDISNAMEMIESDPERFWYTKVFVWQSINELEELVQQNNIDRKLLSFKMSAKELNVKTSNPDLTLNFYAKASKYRDVIAKIRNRLTELLLNILTNK